MTQRIVITTKYIKLDSLLKFSGVCQTGGEAKNLIIKGNVSVNGEICTQRGRKIKGGDVIGFKGSDDVITVVRAG